MGGKRTKQIALDDRGRLRVDRACLLFCPRSWAEVLERIDLEVHLAALDLRAKEVAADLDVEPTHQGLAALALVDGCVREQDHARACAPHRLAALDELTQRREYARALAHHGHGGRLAAGHDEALDPLKLLGQPNLAHART